MRDEYDHVDTEFGAFAPSNTVSADFARQLERELSKVTESLRKAIVWAEAASHRITDRQNINWTYLNEARATLEAMQGGGAA
jgi:hypothetical protein